jgi:hypothetical protein
MGESLIGSVELLAELVAQYVIGRVAIALVVKAPRQTETGEVQVLVSALGDSEGAL